MVLTAVRGAIGFLTRAPVGADEASWDAFRTTPVAFPLAGYLVGVALSVPFVLPVPDAVVALAFVAWVYAVTGVAHADAVADLGDAAATHGSPADRRGAMTDTAVGVGGVLALALVVLALYTLAGRVAALPVTAVALVVAAEVGAKLAMAVVACLGTPTHDGLGAAVAGDLTRRDLVVPVLVSVPAVALTRPRPAAGVAVVAAVLAAGAVLAWSTRRLGGVSGDVIGATNELARVAALLAGVLAWMH